MKGTTIKISRQEARGLMLAAQGLEPRPQAGAGKEDVLEAIRRMGLLQIDTINVVARSPYLVLWSRLGDYRPEWLDELLAEGRIFETWAHALCFLPGEDFPIFRRFMLERQRADGRVHAWMSEHAPAVEMVMERIRQNGGARSVDFENKDRPPGGWWNWKEEKTALECLFDLGELMIARREKFQRVYDLRERVRPGWDDDQAVPLEEAYRRLTLKTVRALGVALEGWAPDYFRLPKKGNAARLAALAEEGRLLRAEVDGLPGPAYIDPQAWEARPAQEPDVTTLLSPFDPLVWDRRRAKELFDFDYRIECYTPAPKRRYGYFSLPILHRGALVGRLDPKAHRKEGIFEVKSLHLEPGVELSGDLEAGLRGALEKLAAWHGTPRVVGV